MLNKFLVQNSKIQVKNKVNIVQYNRIVQNSKNIVNLLVNLINLILIINKIIFQILQ